MYWFANSPNSCAIKAGTKLYQPCHKLVLFLKNKLTEAHLLGSRPPPMWIKTTVAKEKIVSLNVITLAWPLCFIKAWRVTINKNNQSLLWRCSQGDASPLNPFNWRQNAPTVILQLIHNHSSRSLNCRPKKVLQHHIFCLFAPRWQSFVCSQHREDGMILEGLLYLRILAELPCQL